MADACAATEAGAAVDGTAPNAPGGAWAPVAEPGTAGADPCPAPGGAAEDEAGAALEDVGPAFAHGGQGGQDGAGGHCCGA